MLSTFLCSRGPSTLQCVFSLECVCFVTYLYRQFSLMKKGVRVIACLCDHFVMHFNEHNAFKDAQKLVLQVNYILFSTGLKK